MAYNFIDDNLEFISRGKGGLLIMNDVQNGTHFYGYDGNGNVALMVNCDNGKESANYEYGPFGEVIKQTDIIAHRWAVGNNSDGTYWSSDFMPSKNKFPGYLHCHGKINFRIFEYIIIPTNLPSGYTIERHIVTSQTITDFIRDYAKRRFERIDQPFYNICIFNCISWSHGLAQMAENFVIRKELDKIKNEKP